MSSVESASPLERAAGEGGLIRLTLPDGTVKEVPFGTTGRAVAESIGPHLAKDALAGKIDGRVVDLAARVDGDAKIEIVTPKSPEALALYRHSTAHLTANAVKRLFPTVQIGIGPVVSRERGLPLTGGDCCR